MMRAMTFDFALASSSLCRALLKNPSGGVEAESPPLSLNVTLGPARRCCWLRKNACAVGAVITFFSILRYSGDG